MLFDLSLVSHARSICLGRRGRWGLVYEENRLVTFARTVVSQPLACIPPEKLING